MLGGGGVGFQPEENGVYEHEALVTVAPGSWQAVKTGFYEGPLESLTRSDSASISQPSVLPDGVMAAPEILDLLVMVRIHVGQPVDALQKAACSWPAAGGKGGIGIILRMNRRGEWSRASEARRGLFDASLTWRVFGRRRAELAF